MATREWSTPEVVRRGEAAAVGATRACTSTGTGRRPSRVTVAQVPGTWERSEDRNSPLGSSSPTMPRSPRSKQPTSSVGP